MNSFKMLVWLGIAALTPILSSPVWAQTAPVEDERTKAAPEDEIVFEQLMGALETGDYAAFVARGDEGFRRAMSKVLFETVRVQLAPRLEAGTKTRFLGEIKQRNQRVLLWKVSFVDESDDVLARLSLKDGQVSGFLLN